MKKAVGFVLKAGAVLALILAAAAALAPVLLRRYLPPEKVRALVAQKAAESLHRQVRLGEVSYSLLGGLTLSEVAVSERPDFSAGTFVSAKSFHVRPQWRPLLQRRIVLDSVGADGLSVNAVKRASGGYNFSDLRSTAPADGSAPAFALDIGKVRISEGGLSYRDEASGARWKVSRLVAKLGHVRLSGPVDVELFLDAAGSAGGKPVAASLSYSGTVDPSGKAGIRKLVVESDGRKLEVSGTVLDFSAPKVELKFALAEKGAPLAQGSFAGLITPSPPGAAGDFEARTPGFALAKALALPALKAAGRFDYRGDQVAVSKLRIEGGFGELEASGSVGGLSAAPIPDLEVSVKLDLPRIRSEDVSWAKLPSGYVSPAMGVSGKVHLKGDDLAISALHVRAKAGSTDISGTVRGLTSAAPQPDLNVQAKLDLPTLTSADLPLQSVPAGLEIPATKWDLDAAGTLDEVKIRRLRLIAGNNDVEVAGGHIAGLRSATPLFSVLFKCRAFDLAELTRLSPQTRDAGLSGTGFFAVEVTGKWPRPILAGKMKFKDLGATVGGLKLSDFTGTASFDERRIDVPNLAGKVADGTLAMDLTVKDYASSPAVDLEANLDRFDLGAFLKAKAAVSSNAAPTANSPPAAPLAAKGKLTVGKLLHSSAEAEGLKLAWDLEGITPDLRKLSGSANFRVADGGKINSLGDMAEQSLLVKVLVSPLVVVQKIGRLGGAHLFPDFNNVHFSDAAGDYAFQNGLMQVRNMHLVSEAGAVSGKGTIDLPNSGLDLAVTAQVANVAPIGVDVTGTFDKPKTRVQLAKFLLGRQQDVETGAAIPTPR